MNTPENLAKLHILPQPQPIINNYPTVQDAVIEDLIITQKRAATSKYQATKGLQPFNGRNSFVDVYQELLDGCVYMKSILFTVDRLHLLADQITSHPHFSELISQAPQNLRENLLNLLSNLSEFQDHQPSQSLDDMTAIDGLLSYLHIKGILWNSEENCWIFSRSDVSSSEKRKRYKTGPACQDLWLCQDKSGNPWQPVKCLTRQQFSAVKETFLKQLKALQVLGIFDEA
jgi:hypothetical protein